MFSIRNLKQIILGSTLAAAFGAFAVPAQAFNFNNPDDKLVYCQLYATQAQADVHTNQKYNCGNSGPAWGDTYAGHLNWCMSQKNTTWTKREATLRMDAAAKCDRCGDYAIQTMGFVNRFSSAQCQKVLRQDEDYTTVNQYKATYARLLSTCQSQNYQPSRIQDEKYRQRDTMQNCDRKNAELAGPVFTNKKVWMSLVPASWTPKPKGIIGKVKSGLEVARAHEQPAVWVPEKAPVQKTSAVEEVTPVGPSPVTTSRSGQTDDELAHHGEVVEAPVQQASAVEEVTPVGPTPVTTTRSGQTDEELHADRDVVAIREPQVVDRVVEVPQFEDAVEEIEPNQAEPGRGRQILKRGAKVLAVGAGAAATAVVAHKVVEYGKDHKGVLSTGASILKERVKYRILHMGEKRSGDSGLRVKAKHVAKALGGGLLGRLARR